MELFGLLILNVKIRFFIQNKISGDEETKKTKRVPDLFGYLLSAGKSCMVELR